MRPARAATSLGYMCWEGYNDPRIIDPFNAANDTDVVFDLIVDSPGGFAKLQAGASREIDVVSSDLPWITRMGPAGLALRSEEHTSELQSLMRNSSAVFCLKKKSMYILNANKLISKSNTLLQLEHGLHS